MSRSDLDPEELADAPCEVELRTNLSRLPLSAALLQRLQGQRVIYQQKRTRSAAPSTQVFLGDGENHSEIVSKQPNRSVTAAFTHASMSTTSTPARNTCITLRPRTRRFADSSTITIKGQGTKNRNVRKTARALSLQSSLATCTT